MKCSLFRSFSQKRYVCMRMYATLVNTRSTFYHVTTYKPRGLYLWQAEWICLVGDGCVKSSRITVKQTSVIPIYRLRFGRSSRMSNARGDSLPPLIPTWVSFRRVRGSKQCSFRVSHGNFARRDSHMTPEFTVPNEGPRVRGHIRVVFIFSTNDIEELFLTRLLRCTHGM